ncbi:DUF1302 domain-containing protein [Nevskia sp.]|uniref:DUF1302 domain-containing protein n=1 Tax=Nevskia sp. TaxID=1929292 RepID=UPI0025EF4D10|nr:DUF1302 domain-containing protein [Nevskia sp.]
MQTNDPVQGAATVYPSLLRRAPVAALAAAVSLMAGGPAAAFQFEVGPVQGNLDNTVSYGALWRAKGRSESLVGIANGGAARSVNADDGNLNYDAGDIVNQIFRATHELELKYGENLAVFVRGSEFFDLQVAHELEKFGGRGRDRLQQHWELLDAFVSLSGKPFGDRTTNVRVGNQVINWGESTFIQNGINATNPIDVLRLRAPGAELREALRPSPLLSISQELTDALTVEAYVQARFDNFLLDPRGSFFSTTDIASDDGDRAVVTFGRRDDDFSGNPLPPNSPIFPTSQALGLGPFDPAASVWVGRTGVRDRPKGLGQFGVATRYFADWLGSTEFGAYYLSYHSRAPLVSAIKSNDPRNGSGTTSVLTPTPLGAVSGQNGSAAYFLEYPEDINLFGLSFNTQLPSGIALQGEYTYRPNLPLQRGATELLLTALNLPSNFAANPATIAAGAEIRGWQRIKAHQIQATATQVVPTILGAQQLALVGEIGYAFLDLPGDVLFEGPGVALPALQASANAASGGSTQRGEGYATQHSWGYRAVARLDYLSLIGAINVSPRAVFSHDVKGVSPTFNEGSQAATFGVNFNYQQVYTVDFSYTSFFGGREYCGADNQTNPALAGSNGAAAGQRADYCTSANPLKDRDFIALTMTYAF